MLAKFFYCIFMDLDRLHLQGHIHFVQPSQPNKHGQNKPLDFKVTMFSGTMVLPWY